MSLKHSHRDRETQLKLTVSRGGIVYRGAKLWNLMSQDLRNEEKLIKFKHMVKKWIYMNVPIKLP